MSKKSYVISGFLVVLGLVLVGYIVDQPTLVSAANSTGTLLPIAGGTYTSWTPSVGATHYTMVDEASCNGTVDYNRTLTVGSRDSYTIDLSTIPDNSTISAIQITPCASKDGSGGANSTMKVFYRYNGLNSSDAGNYSLTGTTPVGLAATNFNGLSLIKTSSSVLEIGAVLTAGSKGARLSRIATVITYTPAPPAAPTNLSASVGSSLGTTTPVTLSWTDNSSNETLFVLERGIDSVNFSIVGYPVANSTSYDDYAPNGATYYYRIKARNGSGDSAYSNTATAIVP